MRRKNKTFESPLTYKLFGSYLVGEFRSLRSFTSPRTITVLRQAHILLAATLRVATTIKIFSGTPSNQVFTGETITLYVSGTLVILFTLIVWVQAYFTSRCFVVQVTRYSSGVGQVWYVLTFIFRLIIVASLGSAGKQHCYFIRNAIISMWSFGLECRLWWL